MKYTSILMFCSLVLCTLTEGIAQDFRVQIAAYAEAMPDSFFRDKGVANVIASTDQMGMHRYFAGSYNTREEAEKIQQDMIGKGFTYASVIDLEEQRVLCGANCPYFRNGGPVFVQDPKREATLQNIYFDFGRSSLNAESKVVLDAVCQKLKENPNLKLKLLGYTDGVGSAQANMQLAASRARSARNYLINKGIRADRMFIKVFGEAEPIAANAEEVGEGKMEDLPENRKWNRRVVLAIIDDAGEIKTDDAVTGGK